MKTITQLNGLTIKLWLDDIEEGALAQARNLAELPFAFKHIAIMPDSHLGYGMPIGGVMATEGVVSPNCVGVDIGCGMCAVKTSLKDIDKETLKKIMGEIRKAVPVGFKKHKENQDIKLMPDFKDLSEDGNEESRGCFEMTLDKNEYPIVSNNYNNALKSLGTLGGGNHFIEIQKGSDGHIWVMIHSGSRNIGKQVCDHYKRLAYDLNHKWHSKIPEVGYEHYLGFLPLDSQEGKDYLKEMQYCVDYALENRRLMMDRVMGIFGDSGLLPKKEAIFSYKLELINIAHNYAKMENHFGKNVMVHRKGATLASLDNIGIIPGSQGTKSYIVRGLGNCDSFNSCSHGAGRTMGRKQAQRELSFEDEKKKLDDLGVIHALRGDGDLDEAPGAYKPIDEVMRNQTDLVEKLVELSPLGVIKG